MKYAHILLAVASECWAIDSDKLDQIVAFLALQASLEFVADTTGTSLTVVSSAGLPAPAAGDQFRVRIDNELLAVTAVARTTWTVVRGIEGSTPATHASGAVVTQVVTAGALVATGGNVTRVVYTNAVPARPTGAVYVEWVGQVDPAGNALDGDTWTPTA